MQLQQELDDLENQSQTNINDQDNNIQDVQEDDQLNNWQSQNNDRMDSVGIRTSSQDQVGLNSQQDKMENSFQNSNNHNDQDNNNGQDNNSTAVNNQQYINQLSFNNQQDFLMQNSIHNQSINSKTSKSPPRSTNFRGSPRLDQGNNSNLNSNRLQSHIQNAQNIRRNNRGASQNINQTSSRHNYLDREERDLINQAANLSKEEIWEKLEQKRFNQLKRAAVNLQSDMIFHNRCPKCTLQPPCKHYETADQIIAEGTHIIQQPSFKQHISPKKREVIIKTLKEQQKAHQQMFQQSQELINQSQVSINSKQTMNQPQFLNQDANQQQLNDGDTFLTNMDYQSIQKSIKDDISQHQALNNLQTPKQQRLINRNMFNNTVNGGPGGLGMGTFRNQNDSKNIQQSNLSQYGANIMNNQSLQKRQYLRKRNGNGGSPTNEHIQQIFNESKISKEGPLIPKNLQDQNNQNRDRTTVRIRTKNNQYIYGEATFGQPAQSTKNGLSQNHQYSFMENSQQSLYERERLQAVIAKYKEDKIQRQIERIEQERLQLELEKKLQKDSDIKRRRYIEVQKQKLLEYQSSRQQEESEKSEQEKMERQRWIMRERMRQGYFESQRKYIADYKEQKRKTDELLMIPSQFQTKNIPAYFPPQALYQPQVNNAGIMTKAGQQFISSGQGKIQNPSHINRNQYTNENVQENQDILNDEEDYDDYYGEAVNQFDQQQVSQSQQAMRRKKNTSTGIIGQNDSQQKLQQNQQNIIDNKKQLNQEGHQQSKGLLESKRDSLDLIQ